MRRETWFWRVKAAQRDLIAQCGGVVRAAEIAGCSPSWVGKCNTANEDAFLSAPQKRALEADAGEPVVSRVECELLGFAVAAPGGPAASAAGDAFSAHAGLMREFGDLLSGFSERVRDGDFSRGDGSATDRDLSDIIRAAEDFRRVIAAHAAKAEGAAPS
ncbi:MAG TPA: hypothetical protein VGV17_03115 [Bosea sp. (in: a-proteobacteria)]|jgi:hypothetical protein|uniref:hypothetical protein n=1 Tax=Bosea sp. (in: a-proteobacteria) TaxID=1871050 RepID=UPI002DDD7D33|nr:hypothetical protein [Bosea sp. (in: a-proteobacteria)]HEV2552736.1 hypothetical protein [Bosea sp. (in: a-proteobacteria)]